MQLIEFVKLLEGDESLLKEAIASEEEFVEIRKSTQKNSEQIGKTSCNTCGLAFESLQDQRDHFKSDFHRLNLKRIYQGKLAIDEAEANNILEQDDIESLSASSSEDSDDEDEELADNIAAMKCTESGSQLVAIALKKNQVGWGYPAMICDSTGDKSEIAVIMSRPVVVVMLLRAGHFAGVVYECGKKVISSKSFHRYVVRKGQGGSQSKNDNRKGKAKSAGAQMRRHNEIMLQQDISELMSSWSSHFSKASRVFISVAKTNRKILFPDTGPVKSSDTRVRLVPFTTHRPTIKHAEFVARRLCSIAVESEAEFQKRQVAAKSASKPQVLGQPQQLVEQAPKPPIEPTADINVEEDPIHYQPVFDAAIHGNSDLIVNFFPMFGSDIRDYQSHALEGMTLLHVAAQNGHADLVWRLLEFGCSPCVRDLRGRLAYACASKHKDVRDMFRKYRGSHEEQWDYDAAGIPEALTDEMELKRKEKLKEKKKRQQQKKKEEQQKAKQALLEREAQEEAARIAFEANAPRCSLCEKPVDSKNSFSQNTFTFCSSDCMTRHRRELSVQAALKRASAAR